jgi:hypothetical protein
MKKKSIKSFKNQINLNQKQIKQLYEISKKFPDIENFILEQDHDNGIGPVVKVKFTIFDENKNDTVVNITDFAAW